MTTEPPVSYSRRRWLAERQVPLGELLAAHQSVGGSGRGRRFATQQINHAYAVMLAAQFQAYCRDFHTECAEALVRAVPIPAVADILLAAMLRDRRLDRGNASPPNLGADFGRFGGRFWAELAVQVATATADQAQLGELNDWRNAIVHQDFDAARLGGTIALRLERVRRWHAACHRLVAGFDALMASRLQQLTGVPPW